MISGWRLATFTTSTDVLLNPPIMVLEYLVYPLRSFQQGSLSLCCLATEICQDKEFST
jgi:hypothetical protein